jgi:hypothetical protein
MAAYQLYRHFDKAGTLLYAGVTICAVARIGGHKSKSWFGDIATLSRWIARGDFPPGRYLGPNTRVWLVEEVEAWLASRPVGKAGT